MLKSFSCLLLLLLASGCVTTANDRWLGEDKAKHLAVAAAIAGASTAFAKDQDLESGETMIAAVGVTMAFGAGKEFKDRRPGGTGWSWKDLAWNLVGALAGFVAVDALD